MASCSCTNLQALMGIAADCAQNIGGIKAVYLRPYDSEVFTYSGDTISAVASASTDTGWSATWYEYCFRPNTSEYNQTLNVSDNGSKYVEHSISLVFKRMEAAKRAEMVALTYGDVNAVVLDANGKYWGIPQEEPVSATDGNGATGLQKSDSNQYGITIGNEVSTYAYELTAEAVATLKSLVNA